MEENEELSDESLSERINHSSFQRSFSTTVFNILCGFKNVFCSGMFVKGSAFVVGFWNPSKGLRAIMAVIPLLVCIYYVIASLFKALICRQFQTPLNTWLCGNTSSTNSSSASLTDNLDRIEVVDLLSLVSSSAVHTDVKRDILLVYVEIATKDSLLRDSGEGFLYSRAFYLGYT